MVSVVILTFLLLIQQSRHIHRDYNIQSLRRTLKDQEDRNHHLQVKYDRENSYEKIRDYAVVTLNMQFPKRIIYINE